MNNNIKTIICISLLLSLLLGACGPAASTDEPTSTPTLLPTASVTLKPTLIPATSTPTSTPTPDLGKIYFSIRTDLYRMNLDGSDRELLLPNIGKSEHFSIDPLHNILYVSQWDAHLQISAFNLLSPYEVTLIDGPESGGQGLAIDPTTSMVFLGLYYHGVYAMDWNKGSGWTQLVNSTSLFPMLGQRGQLDIDPANHHIYFRSAFNGDCELCRYIWRVDFNGNNLIKIIPANGGDALALDLTERKIYYSDVPDNSTIMRANLDGSGPELVFSVPTPYHHIWDIALDVQHKKIYMSLWGESTGINGKAIARVNMDGTDYEIIYERSGNVVNESNGIAIYKDPATSDPTRQPSSTCFPGWSRLTVGKNARVTSANSIPNRVRSEPKVADNIIAQLDPGTVVKVLEGPVCEAGLVFWKVQSALIPGGVGWTAEGGGSEYWLEPYK